MPGGPKVKIPWIIVIAVVSIAGGFGTTSLLDSAGLFPESKGFAHVDSAVVRQINTPTVTRTAVSPPETPTVRSEPTSTPESAENTATPSVSEPGTVEAGATETVVVPSPTVTASPTAVPQDDIDYVIKQGDTLFDIARTYNSTVDAIVSRNGLPDDHTLALGQKLKIPRTASKPASTPDSSSSGPSYQTYIVKPGDTLFSIALRYNTTVDAIVRYNGLASADVLKDGQQLTIPTGR